MAGAGSRFEKCGYAVPKPLIPIKNMGNKPMVQVVVENINIDADYIFIVREEHDKKYNLTQFLKSVSPNCKIVKVNYLTEGAACTTLLAKKYIDNNHPLLIANSDQFVEWNSGDFLQSISDISTDGSILTFENNDPNCSYVKLDGDGCVAEVREKQIISNEATVGIYYWTRGCNYVKFAEQMIQKNIRTNNEFYTAPTYNEAIEDKFKIKTFRINKVWSLGSPEDLNTFIEKYKKA